MKTLTILLAAAALGACTTGPRYRAPPLEVPATFDAGASASAGDMRTWWRAFGDPVLDSLVGRALGANLDAAQARARVREARLQERILRGGQGLQVDASTSAGTTHLSKNAIPSSFAGLLSGGSGSSGSSPGLGVQGETFRSYQAGFDASWELDVFGGGARANEAARARTEAAVWSQRDADVVLVAEVARTYEQVRLLQRRLALQDEALATERDILAHVQARARNGLVAGTDVSRQARAVAQAMAQREDLAAQADAALHALATLLGRPPSALASELTSVPAAAAAPIDVPPGLPSELLQRRPDLRQAERQLAAATADMGVANADLYPKFSLTGALQLASRQLSTLFDADSRQDSLSAKISLPLFNRDRLHATVDLRQAQADEALAGYRKAVLAALRDVEDGLTRLQADRRRLDELHAAARAARDEADSAAVQFRHGLTPATDMLAARQAWQSAQDAALQADAAAMQDVVAIYKALGGGWDERRDPIDEEPARGRAS